MTRRLHQKHKSVIEHIYTPVDVLNTLDIQ